MSLRWKKLSATTAAVPVRRGAKTLETRPCHLHLVRAESAPNANGGKQLALLLQVKRGLNAWLVVRTGAQLVELHTQVSARCASTSTVPKLPKLPDLNSRAAGRSPSEAGEVDHLPVSLDPHVTHKIQEFLRRLVGGFHGPEVEAFVSIDTPPSRALNPIEAWLFGPEAEKGVAKQGEMSEYNARDKQWEPWYFVLRGSSLLKYRSARQENDPASVYELGTAATARAATEHQPAGGEVEGSDGERCALELEYNGKTRRLACASKQHADQWIDAFNQLNASNNSSSINSSNNNSRKRRNVVFGVELSRVAHVKNDPWWRLCGPKPGQGASFIACGAAQFVDELAGFLLAAGKGKEGLFDQLPTTELVRQIREGESVDYGAYQATPEKVAGLLLVFLHQLPVPLISFEFYDSFVAVFSIQEEKKRKKLVKALLSLLPSLNLKVLRLVVGFLAHFLATLPKNSGSSITSAFAGVILRPLCYGDVARYAAAATPRLLDLLVACRHKFWDYEEGFGEGEAKPSRAAGSFARTKSAAEIRTNLKLGESRIIKVEPSKDKVAPKAQAKAIPAIKIEPDPETESGRAVRSGTLDLFAQMAQGAATMQKSATAKRRERRKRSLTFHKEGSASIVPTSSAAALPSVTVSSSPLAIRRLTKSNTVDGLERKKPAAAADTSDNGGAEGEAAGPKANGTLGTAAKRRERRKRSLTREQLQSTPPAASGEQSASQLFVGAVHAVKAGMTMSARLAEISRLKQQRMGLDNVVKANDAPAPAPAPNKSYRNLGGGSEIGPRRPIRDDEEEKEEKKDAEREEKKEAEHEEKKDAEHEVPESPKPRSPFLQELQMNTLAQNYRAKCLEVDVVGEEREKMGFDPSQQAEQMGALRSWGNPAAPTPSAVQRLIQEHGL